MSSRCNIDNLLYYLEVPDDISDIVAHLFEHAFILDFSDYATRSGHHPAIIASLHGETFRHVIFIYDETPTAIGAQLLSSFINQNPTPSTISISRAVKQIASECRTTYSFNRDELEKQIGTLSTIGFQPISELPKLKLFRQEQPSSLPHDKAVAKHTPLATKVATVNYIVDRCSISDRVVFSNIFPVLTRMTTDALADCGAYYSCSVLEDEQINGHDTIIGGVDYYVPKAYDIGKIHDGINNLLDTDISLFTDDLHAHAQNAYTPSGLIYDYASIGMLASWQLLRGLLTPDNFVTIWNRIQIYSVDESPDNRPPANSSAR